MLPNLLSMHLYYLQDAPLQNVLILHYHVPSLILEKHRQIKLFFLQWYVEMPKIITCLNSCKAITIL